MKPKVERINDLNINFREYRLIRINPKVNKTRRIRKEKTSMYMLCREYRLLKLFPRIKENIPIRKNMR
ncbi:MAG TPA: hypothetical protein ENG62_03165 [Thermoplasmatales archaeon]|nr:hypothetical protein [Thermoplasmatales archaeon]